LTITDTPKAAFLGALYTVLSLIGGLLLGIAAGSAVFSALPGHTTTNPSPVLMLAAAVPALLGMFAGAAAWGVLMGRLASETNWRRMALAGGLGFAPIAIMVGLLLQVLEPIAVKQLGAQVPLHRLFTFIFVPAAFLVAGVGAWALGIGLRNRALAWALFWRAGLAAALAFLAVNLIMEASGRVVGAPHAAESFTMLTVMFVSDMAAALAAGAVIGLLLARRSSVTLPNMAPSPNVAPSR